MIKNQKHIFWIALILTIFVFSAGVLFGFAIENWRSNEILEIYEKAELDLFDVRLQSEILSSDLDISCEKLVNENINFGDRIFEEAKKIEEIESSITLSESIKVQHKRYDLLRTLFWLNSIKIKEECSADYHNVVYLYQYNDPTVDQRAKQAVFSRLLSDLKEEEGANIMLIPIAADNNILSIELLLDLYEVKKEDLPLILIDEQTKITEITNIDEIQNYLS